MPTTTLNQCHREEIHEKRRHICIHCRECGCLGWLYFPLHTTLDTTRLGADHYSASWIHIPALLPAKCFPTLAFGWQEGKIGTRKVRKNKLRHGRVSYNISMAIEIGLSKNSCSYKPIGQPDTSSREEQRMYQLRGRHLYDAASPSESRELSRSFGSHKLSHLDLLIRQKFRDWEW